MTARFASTLTVRRYATPNIENRAVRKCPVVAPAGVRTARSLAYVHATASVLLRLRKGRLDCERSVASEARLGCLHSENIVRPTCSDGINNCEAGEARIFVVNECTHWRGTVSTVAAVDRNFVSSWSDGRRDGKVCVEPCYNASRGSAVIESTDRGDDFVGGGIRERHRGQFRLHHDVDSHQSHEATRRSCLSPVSK